MKAASEASPDPFARVGSTLGHTYLVEGVIGSGAHGVLYSARHLRLQCRCAVKVLRLAPGPRLDALLGTVGGCFNVAHPHLAPPFDIMPLQDGTVLLGSPLLPGEDLATRVALRGKLAETEGLVVARQAAAGLLALHRRGLVHGNLTARNLFLARYDDVALDDALGESKGAQSVRLLDMGLHHAEGKGATTADDQQALALILLEHVADLSLPQRRALERAQTALPQKRFPSMQEFWQAYEAQDDPASRSTSLTPKRGGPNAASTQTALVPRGKAQRSRGPDGDLQAAGAKAQALAERGSGRGRQLVLAAVVVVVAMLGGVGGAVMWRRHHRQGGAPGQGAQAAAARPRAPEGKEPAGEAVTLRFALSPPGAEVLLGGAAVPMGNVMRVSRLNDPLPILARAPGYLPFEGTVVPDQDRTVDIALLPAAQGATAEAADGKDHGKKRRHHGGRK